MEILARLLAGACLRSLAWRSLGDFHGIRWKERWFVAHPDIASIVSDDDGLTWQALVMQAEMLS